MPLDQAEATRLMNAKWGKATYPPPTLPIMLRLMRVNGTASTNGTEVPNAGGSAYAPQNGSAATPASATNGVLATNAAVTYSNMPAGDNVGIEEWTSDTTPKRTTFGSLTTPKTTALGDMLTLTAGAFTDTLS